MIPLSGWIGLIISSSGIATLAIGVGAAEGGDIKSAKRRALAGLVLVAVGFYIAGVWS